MGQKQSLLLYNTIGKRPVPFLFHEPDPVVTLAHKGQTVFLAKLLLEMVRQKTREIRDVKSSSPGIPTKPSLTPYQELATSWLPSCWSCLGDHRERYPTPQTIRALAGICPITIESGQKRDETYHLQQIQGHRRR